MPLDSDSQTNDEMPSSLSLCIHAGLPTLSWLSLVDHDDPKDNLSCQSGKINRVGNNLRRVQLG